MIEIKNLYKSFEDKILFEDYSLTINKGEFIVFAGVSGCGKTTLLNMIGGLESPDKGTISVDGSLLSKKKNLRAYFLYKVGFLFQNFALVEDKTIRQNLEFIQKKARTEMTLEEALDIVGLGDRMEEKVYKLSGGEQQRVALARLLLKKCDIVLADEPTGSLDRGNGQKVLEMLHKMNEMGKTIIMVTHDEDIIKAEKKVIYL